MESRLRASPEQFILMLDFMERNGDLSRPQPGQQGRLRGDHLWNELTELLNSFGGNGIQKPVDKWKRVWSDWKTKTKKKASVVRRDTQGTGGGPSRARALNPLEERVLMLIGLGAVTGQEEVQEVGFEAPPPPEPDVNMVPSPLPPPTLEVAPTAPTVDQVSLQIPDTQLLDVGLTEHCAPPTSNPRRQNREESARSPSISMTSPRRRRAMGRRRRHGVTPFEQATSEFVRIEESRLRLEEMRIQKRHEQDMERIRVESERNAIEANRIAMEQSRNEILKKIADTVELIFLARNH